MTAIPLKVIWKTADGREVQFKEYLPGGTLTERYFVEIGDDGLRYFLKKATESENCFGGSCRKLIENEEMVYQHLQHPPLTYRGRITLLGTTCLLFDDILSRGREGRSLADLIFSSEQPPAKEKSAVTTIHTLPLTEIVDIIMQAAQQVQRYHEQNVIHCDITPDNILLMQQVSEGYQSRQVIVSDLGLARRKDQKGKYLFSRAETAGISSAYYGSDRRMLHNTIYHPPDLDGENLILPSYDTYNLSNILCLLITGRLAEYFSEAHPEKRMYREKIARNVQSSLKDKCTPDQRRQLWWIILKGIDEDSSKRYKTAQELYDDLAKLNMTTEKKAVPKPETTSYSIPEHIRNYPLSPPPWQEMYQPEVNAMYQQLEKLASSTPLRFPAEHLFGDLPTILDAAKRLEHANRQKEAAAWRKNMGYVKLVLKNAGIGLALGFATGSLYLLW